MERRKFVIGMGSLAAGGAAAMGSGAFSAAEVERAVNVEITDDSVSLLGLEPGPETGDIVTTESRQYGGYDADAEALVIDFSNGYNGMDTGINAGSTYQLGTPPKNIDEPSHWEDRLLVQQEDDVIETDHAFSIRNQGTQKQNVTVRFEGDNPSRNRKANVGLILVDSDGNAPADTDPEGDDYYAEVSIEDVDPGESVYVVLSFYAQSEIRRNDMSGDITITAD
ncbi:hypothetical protein [Halalkaliarchaeum desulfuricum]|uniref:hypothetical protein n=1 Tax=Halalkaliarchaeum desulfuricum TaxID=2055893 RepID=UPI00105AB079|nr:hypothetical protein [Halalkaliarchaeum desulfuricum]